MNKNSLKRIRRRLVFACLCGLVLLGLNVVPLGAADSEWRVALPGWQYVFPRDHRSHEGFRTEWWYFTGNVRTESGEAFGYQLTFFRQGIFPSQAALPEGSQFFQTDFHFAHFAISSLGRKQHRFAERMTRGAFGEAGNGSGEDPRLAWNGDWSLTMLPDGRWQIQANEDDFALNLVLQPAKPPIFHGADGVSQKAEGEGRASHYYSFTRLKTEGTLTFAGNTQSVSGDSWFDQEWATNQLAENQTGWDWFSIQFDNGSELMLYQMRTREGPPDPYSSGTFVRADGSSERLKVEDYQLIPIRTWKSRATGAEYPVEWEIVLPKMDLRLRVTSAFPEQEMALEGIAYWEGSIDVDGRDAQGVDWKGRGYLEMSGYASELTPLQSK